MKPAPPVMRIRLSRMRVPFDLRIRRLVRAWNSREGRPLHTLQDLEAEGNGRAVERQACQRLSTGLSGHHRLQTVRAKPDVDAEAETLAVPAERLEGGSIAAVHPLEHLAGGDDRHAPGQGRG